MCYSALVNQSAKNLGFTYKARIQIDMFDDLFTRRSEGGGEIIPPAMEFPFLEDPKTATEKKIAKTIIEYRKGRIGKYETDLFTQKKRLADAERKLLSKVTKKAQDDVRIATAKIESFLGKIAELKKTKANGDFARIFPLQYAPLVVSENGKLVVAPFRYLLRPKNQTELWDRKYYGSYNSRRDNLDGRTWKPIFEKNHGIIQIKQFWERVALHDYEKRNLRSGEEEKRIEITFKPKGSAVLVSPCIFEINRAPDLLSSFALVTDDPNPEVKEAGHDRTPIFMKESNIPGWLDTADGNFDRYFGLLADKQLTTFVPQLGVA